MSKNLRQEQPSEVVECDVLVVGGGSGGLACAQATAKLVKGQVIICDYVRPSDTKQTSWGFGGTCVNVGCVPKKLFHRAGYFGQCIRDGELTAYGFSQEFKPADWDTVVTTVQNHVKMLNFTYRVKLPDNCKYHKARCEFNGNKEVRLVKANGEIILVKVKKAIVIAVGGRPLIPNIPGAREFGISSDDVFSLKQSPKKTLVVGSSYIGLETASFLHSIGCETTLLVRSRPLRSMGFDEDSADKVLQLMESSGLRVLRHVQLTKLTQGIVAHFSDGTTEQYDTVLFATGRFSEVSHLGKLPSAVKVAVDTGKIQVNGKTFLAAEQTSAFPAVYSIGDCAETGALELTPVAVRQGDLVARHIGGLPLDKRMLASLQVSPSTVFALPSEYSRAGLSEQEAINVYGAQDIEVYWRAWEPLETGAAHANSEHLRAFVKFICVKSQDERVVGLHLVTPNSSEVIHGLALSMQLGATKGDFDARVLGIHPTDAEGLCDVTVSKSSGLSFNVASGCGGGRCG